MTDFNEFLAKTIRDAFGEKAEADFRALAEAAVSVTPNGYMTLECCVCEHLYAAFHPHISEVEAPLCSLCQKKDEENNDYDYPLSRAD